MATNTRFATGLHTLVLLARNPEQLQSSETIAGKLQTNAVVIRRILAQLQEASLVRNQKGPSGGSQLVRAAGDITLADVYQAIQQPSLFHDAAVRGAEAKKLTTELRTVLTEAEDAMLDALRQVSIQQIVKKTGRKKV